MNDNKINAIASKLDVDVDVMNKADPKPKIIHKLLYPFVQVGFYLFSALAGFVSSIFVENGSGITYPSNYWSTASIAGVVVNGVISSGNLITSNFLVSHSKIEVKRKQTIYLSVIGNFILSVLTFLLIWKYKVTYPVYAEGLTPKYGVYTKA